MEYNNIIELYLQIIGIKNLGKANANEIILPEIEYLLKTQNYNCKFTKECYTSYRGVYVKVEKNFNEKYKYIGEIEKKLQEERKVR